MDDASEPAESAIDVAALAEDLRAVLGRLRRRLREEAPPGDLTWAQLAVLAHLEREGALTVTSLARLEGVRPQSMGATVASLEGAGLVRGKPDPQDGRQTILSVTAACRKWIAAHRTARAGWLAGAIAANLVEGEREALWHAVKLLERLAAR